MIPGIVFLFLLLDVTSSESTTTTEPPPKTTPKLTGIPQIDYIHDPNLPRELNGYDLSNYPFYNKLPENMYNFTCDNRHDGFYASIPHKCQVSLNKISRFYLFSCSFDAVSLFTNWCRSYDNPQIRT